MTIVLTALPARASLDNLNSKLPVEIEDAEPIDEGTWNAQLLSEFREEDEGAAQWRLVPELRSGFAKRFQLTVRSPFLPGPAEERRGSGDVETELQYLLLEAPTGPSIGISAMGIAPTGKESKGVDSEFKIAVSQDLGSKDHRGHLNLAYDYNARALPDEESTFFQTVAGFSSRLHERLLLMADFVSAQQKTSVKTLNYGELGVRYQIAKRFIGGLGASYGGKEFFLSRFGLQYDF